MRAQAVQASRSPVPYMYEGENCTAFLSLRALIESQIHGKPATASLRAETDDLYITKNTHCVQKNQSDCARNNMLASLKMRCILNAVQKRHKMHLKLHDLRNAWQLWLS
jgi:hypothetical protein